MVDAVLGVGLLGAGPVVQAIHLPTLARLDDRFRIAHIMDIDPSVAETVAARVGARWSTSRAELLADPEVDVVAICSPSPLHAEQVIAAMRAGVRAVLCEKPFATTGEEATRIAAVGAETGVPVIVGAMHAFDPGWLAVAGPDAGGLLQGLLGSAHSIRSRIALPPNSRFEDFATEIVTRPARPDRDLDDPGVRAELATGGVLGLAIHDLPLVRRFLPRVDDLEVRSARVLGREGYVIDLIAGGCVVQLVGAFAAASEPEWTLEVTSDAAHLELEFTPSYVHAGSAVARLSAGGVTTVFGPYDHNGYEGEWCVLHDLVHGRTTDAPTAGSLIDDLSLALRIAEGAAAAAGRAVPA